MSTTTNVTITKTKRIPKDIFGNELKVGDKIVYIVNDHGHTILNWAEIVDITWKESRWYHNGMPFSIKCRKYGERGGFGGEFKSTVFLTSPTVLVVGQSIVDFN